MHRFSSRSLPLANPLHLNVKLFSSSKNAPRENLQQASLGKRFLQRFLNVSQVLIQLQINAFYNVCYNGHRHYKIENRGFGLTIPSNFSSVSSIRQVIRPQTDGEVPAAVQEVLDELHTRRHRIMELLSTVDEMKRQNEKLSLEYSLAEKEKTVAVTAGEKIKDSFQSVDQKFIDLRDEVINLREIESKYKDLCRKHEEMKIDYDKILTDDPSRSKNKDAKLQSLLETSRQEIGRLEKRIERLRNQSPAMVALQKVFSSITKFSNGSTFRHDALNEEFIALQKKYAHILTENFASHAESIGAKELLVQGCMEYVRSSFAYADFDCEIHFTSAVNKELTQYLNEQIDHGFHIRRLSNTSIEVACPERKDFIGPYLGPYGVLSCFLQAFPKRAARIRVYPTISKITIEKRVKVNIIHETCKSSKPGGQAANVTETQVKSSLTFNGQIIARAHSQDTRSQHENKKRADQRVIEESLNTEIQKLKASPPQIKKIDIPTADMNALQCLFQPSNFRSDMYLFGVLQKS